MKGEKAKKERRSVKDKMLDWGGGIVLVYMIVSAGATLWNGHESSNAINAVQSSQTQHHKDLQTIENYAAGIKVEGAAIQSALRDNHGSSYSVLVNLCHLTPGCIVPASTTTTTATTTGGKK